MNINERDLQIADTVKICALRNHGEDILEEIDADTVCVLKNQD